MTFSIVDMFLMLKKVIFLSDDELKEKINYQKSILMNKIYNKDYISLLFDNFINSLKSDDFYQNGGYPSIFFSFDSPRNNNLTNAKFNLFGIKNFIKYYVDPNVFF